MIEKWAADWLEEMRSKGSRGISVENRNGVHQLRWQTTEWDPVKKKRVKRGNYIGSLREPGIVVPAKGLDIRSLDPRAVEAFGLTIPEVRDVVLCDQKISGPMRLLKKVTSVTFDKMIAAFGHGIGDDLWMLAMSRLFGKGRLVRAGRWFSTMENSFGLNCHTDPDALSETLRMAGMSSLAQKTFFESLYEDGMQVAVDMTVVFSRSRGAFLIKRGYNRFKLTCGQYNVVLVCSLENMLPISMKTVAGNVTEGSLKGMIKEFDLPEDVVAVMDRGYNIEEIRDIIDDSGRFFVIPVDRNSVLYESISVGEGAFVYKGSTIRFGHGDGLGYNAFRYENMNLRNDELASLVDDAGGIILGPLPENAGNLILITNLNETAETIYRLFKCRGAVENDFDTGKNLLLMDSSYMHDTFHIQGFNFVTFLSLRIRTELDMLITSAGLDPKLTVEDVLFIYSNATVSKTSEGTIMEHVPADLRRIDEQLGVKLYPKNRE